MIFEYRKPLTFAWAGGRLLILNENQELTDFGDGGMSRGGKGGQAVFEHRTLGNIDAHDTKFIFKDYGVEFDFKVLDNCNFIDKNKAKGKGRYEGAVLHHMKRFSKKRLLENE